MYIKLKSMYIELKKGLKKIDHSTCINKSCVNYKYIKYQSLYERFGFEFDYFPY